MNFKTTYLLFAVLAAILVVLTVVLWQGPTPSTSASFVMAGMNDKTNPFKPDDVTRVVIERKHPAGEDVVFERDSGTDQWRITSPRAYRADSASVNGLITEIRGAQPEKPA